VLVLAFAGASPAAPTAGPTEPPVLRFYPQAGLPWQDLYFANFVDLDPGPGTLDWSCGTQTYDGHTGEDSIIRSFQEKRIGVPVFAAIDGIVIEVSDLLPDEHVERTMTPVDNHVIISSLGRHVRTIYGHLRKGVLVRQGRSAGAVTRRGTRRSARGPSRQAYATSTSAPSSGSSTARCRSRSPAPTAASPSTRSATCRSRATAPPG
jgi:murein DD-endopeptidase MepM/ murein hydrolase activator NlpD